MIVKTICNQYITKDNGELYRLTIREEGDMIRVYIDGKDVASDRELWLPENKKNK
jgi:hypothetical protein